MRWQHRVSLPSAVRGIVDRLLCVHADGENPKSIANNTNSIVRLRPTEKVYNGGTPFSVSTACCRRRFSVSWLLTPKALCTRRAASHLAPGGLAGHAPYAPRPSLLLLGQWAARSREGFNKRLLCGQGHATSSRLSVTPSTLS